ncbi:hypothetical protein ACFW04_012012 [Cataglyphis niger]
MFLEQELEILSKTVNWVNFCREVDISSEQIGGEDKIVEIDEVKIGKKKYNKDLSDRSAETLLLVIKKWIKPSTKIISAKNHCLNNEEYLHEKMNHKYNFVDSDTNIHTQHIERTWRDTHVIIFLELEYVKNIKLHSRIYV